MYAAILIFVGGGAGSLLRWLAGEATATVLPREIFPLGTFIVNLVGCFGIGLVAAWLMSIPELADRTAEGTSDGGWFVELLRQPEWRLAILTGFFGGFTTFSSFGIETLRMLHAQQWGVAVGYVISSVLLGIAATAIGYRLMT